MTGLYFERVITLGAWQDGLRVIPSATTGLGVFELGLNEVDFSEIRGVGLNLRPNITAVLPNTQANRYAHHLIAVTNSYFGSSGDSIETFVGTGECMLLYDAYYLYIYQNSFVDCGILSGAEMQVGVDSIRVVRASEVSFENNVFQFERTVSQSAPPAPLTGFSNAIHIGDDVQTGWVYANTFQRISGSAVLFSPTVDGLVYGSELRYINEVGLCLFVFFLLPPLLTHALFKWYVSMNLLENVGLGSAVAPVFFKANGCMTLCGEQILLVHNTIFLDVPATRLTVSLVKFFSPAGSLVDMEVVNNIFYVQDADVSSTVFVNIIVDQFEQIFVEGNVFAGPSTSYQLVADQSGGYRSLAELGTAGFDVEHANRVVFIPPSVQSRLQALPDPTPNTDSVFGDPNQGTAPPGVDRINGLGVCVNATGYPIDVLFRCPGHERRLLSAVEDLPALLIEAYTMVEGALAIGTGVDVATYFSGYPNIVYNLGEYDLMFRDAYSSDRSTTDPGAVRFITSLEIIEGGMLVFTPGDSWYRDLELGVDSTLELAPLSNATIERLQDLPVDARIVVLPGGRINVLGGSSTMRSGSQIDVGFNGTMRFLGNLTVGSNASCTFNGTRYAEFVQLTLGDGSAMDFYPGSTPLNVTRAIQFGGVFTLRLVARPTESRRRATTVVPVATFPPSSGSGSFSAVNVAPSYPNSQCDTVTVTPMQSTTGLSVAVTVSPKPSCTPGGTPGDSGLPPGAIAGIVIGVVVAVSLGVALFFLLWRRKELDRVGRSLKDRQRASTKIEMERASAQRQSDMSRHSANPDTVSSAPDDPPDAPVFVPAPVVVPAPAPAAAAPASAAEPTSAGAEDTNEFEMSVVTL